MKIALTSLAVLASALAGAQLPDIRVKFDLYAVVRGDDRGVGKVRFFDNGGHHSTVAFSFRLEPGFRAFVSERLDRFPNDADDSLLDEYYVEDPGIWRIGRQYLPFGSGRILRESVLAARGDTNLIFEGLPIAFAACDGSSGHPEGFVGRIGSRIGASFAIGKHFGISGSSLTQVRHPEDSPGKGRGYQQVIGLDAERTFGSTVFRAEALDFRRGQTGLDPDLQLLDLEVGYKWKPSSYVGFGYTGVSKVYPSLFRLSGSFRLDARTSFEPAARFKHGKVFDIGFGLRVRF